MPWYDQRPLLSDLKAGGSYRRALALGGRTDGTPLSLPMTIIIGPEPGPVMWLQGCLHGDEYAGARAIHRFMASLEPANMAGAVIALPVVNLSGWEMKSRVSPIDHLDMNRLGRGAAAGTFSRLAVHRLTKAILANADFALDLHGFRSNYFSLYWRQEDEAGRLAQHLAWTSGAPAVVGTNEDWLAEGMFAVLTRLGRAMILIEAPGEGRIDPEVVDYYFTAVTNIALDQGLISGAKAPSKHQVEITNLIALPAPASGFVDLLVARGDWVDADQVLARILNVHGDPIAQVSAPAGPALILNLDTHGVIHQGEALIMIGQLQQPAAS